MEPKVTEGIEWSGKDPIVNDDSDSDAFEEASSGDGDYQDVTGQEVFLSYDELGSNQEEEIPSSPVLLVNLISQSQLLTRMIRESKVLQEESKGTPRQWYVRQDLTLRVYT